MSWKALQKNGVNASAFSGKRNLVQFLSSGKRPGDRVKDSKENASHKSWYLSDQEITFLRHQINSGIRDWEILQKNIIKSQMEKMYSSYRILTLIVIVSTSLTFIFIVMYLITSKSRQENRIFTRHMLQVQESERERISSKLHDTVCQDLRVLQFQLENEESVNLCKKIASDVRNTCNALTPSDLGEGLVEALISLCSVYRRETDLQVIISIQNEVKDNPAFKAFSKEKNLNIYRIIQEIMNNAVNHADAESLSLLIRTFDENYFKIIISDDGKGTQVTVTVPY